MAFPADVKLVSVTCGTGYDFSGEPIAITLEVTPVLGGSLKRLIHAATGTFMTRDALTFKNDPGSPATFTVPSPAQAETWKDGSGAFFTNWSYSVTVTTRTASGKTQSWIQSFQPIDGQETVDLDLVPDGQIGSPTSAPAPAVTSVNGNSGAVVIDVGEAVTPESVAANLTVEAVDAKLPERLSESALSAAIGDFAVQAEDLFTRLDLRDPDALVVAGAGDSTTDSAGEYLETGFKELLATLYPERPAGVRRYNKSTETLMAYSAWQNGDQSIPGESDVVLLSDTFTRTAPALVGTMPDVGEAWVGSSAAFTINGSRAVYASSAGVGASLKFPAHVGLKASVSATIRMAFNLGANTQTRLMLGRSGTSGSADRIDITMSGTSATTCVLRQNLGGVTTTLATFPAGTIPDNSVADHTVSLAIAADGAVTAKINGATVTVTLSSDMVTALTGETYAGFYTTNSAFEVDNFVVSGDTAPVNIPATVAPLTVYNGGYAGGRASHQIERFSAMYPVRPDLFLICHGHNYSTVDSTPEAFITAIEALVARLYFTYPGVPVGFVSQNPETVATGSRTPEQVAQHLARQIAMRAHCKKRGWVYIPGMEPFAALADGGASKVNTDGVHIEAATSTPANKTGGRLMADALKSWADTHSSRPNAG